MNVHQNKRDDMQNCRDEPDFFTDVLCRRKPIREQHKCDDRREEIAKQLNDVLEYENRKICPYANDPDQGHQRKE